VTWIFDAFGRERITFIADHVELSAAWKGKLFIVNVQLLPSRTRAKAHLSRYRDGERSNGSQDDDAEPSHLIIFVSLLSPKHHEIDGVFPILIQWQEKLVFTGTVGYIPV
jgi:hypothetical protein